mmetsp:Transcript_66706/g.217131  ORF Transcript_66706/g.217131 Transcript_66706/m.217131 type:complete len:230 (-) Transcript_66706:344-1033(-)
MLSPSRARKSPSKPLSWQPLKSSWNHISSARESPWASAFTAKSASSARVMTPSVPPIILTMPPTTPCVTASSAILRSRCREPKSTVTPWQAWHARNKSEIDASEPADLATAASNTSRNTASSLCVSPSGSSPDGISLLWAILPSIFLLADAAVGAHVASQEDCPQPRLLHVQQLPRWWHQHGQGARRGRHPRREVEDGSADRPARHRPLQQRQHALDDLVVALEPHLDH